MELIYLNDDLDVTIERILADSELSTCGLDYEKVKKTVESFQGDELASSVFLKKYALRDENNIILELTLDEAKDRWAKNISGVENKLSLFAKDAKDSKYFRELYDYFLPGGRQMFALGNVYVKNATSVNCYVTEIEDDSIEGIFDAARKIARTYSYGGGIGFCLGKLRPNNSKVSNTAKQSSGAVSFMELYSVTTGIIGQFGRRAALLLSMPISHPDIEEFIEIKHIDKNKVKYANISIKITDEFMNAVINDTNFELTFETQHETIKRIVKARELWQKIIQSARDSAEPGLLFWDNITRDSPTDVYDQLKVVCTNPCITGDTLVYVADGRCHVSIRQLAEENKDVPVFCLDEKSKPTIRMMRNPRITGYNQPVWKVILDDGSIIRATANHKFVLSDGSIKELCELNENDSLKRLTKFKSNIKEIHKEYTKAKSAQDYFWISCGLDSPKAEHRYIASFYHNSNETIKNGFIVHHKDHDAQNNNPNNLVIMSKHDHQMLHRENMLGDQNPMRRARFEWSAEKWEKYSENMSKSTSGEKNGRYSGVSNGELQKHALILTKLLGCRFSVQDWEKYAKENNLVKSFSKCRNNILGGVVELAVWAAKECGFENVELDPRTQKKYNELKSTGFDCYIKDGNIWVNKKCKICNQHFTVTLNRKKTNICSAKCNGEYRKKWLQIEENRNKMNEISKNKGLIKKKQNAEQMINIFLDLRSKLNRDPLFKELVVECKKNNLSHRIGKNSFFNTYEELKNHARQYNHRVVKIEFDCLETVYNGTVDNFHNFFIGGFKDLSDSNKIDYINVRNCGELPLSKDNSCVLGSLLLHRFVKNSFSNNAEFDFDTFGEMTQRAVRHLDNVVELNLGKHPLVEQEETSRLSRRIGLGITGLADMLAALNLKYDSQEALGVVSNIMKVKMIEEYKATINLAKERGAFPLFDSSKHYEQGFCSRLPEDIKELGKKYGQRNSGLSTVAPNGSLSIMAQCSSGIEPIFALSYKRFVELGQERKEFYVYHQGINRFRHITKQEELPDVWVSAHEIDYMFRIKMQAIIQQCIDASISSTINAPRHTDVETVSKIYMEAWRAGLKGITVYVEGSREGILVTDSYKQALKEYGIMDTSVHCVRAEGGDKFYIMISYKDNDIKKPYQVFVLNYKQAEKEGFVKLSNALIKMLRSNNIPEERIDKYISRSNSSLAKFTRFLSLSMKTGLLEKAIDVLSEHATVGTLAAKLYELLNKSVDAKKITCPNPNCGSSKIKMTEGCMVCMDCGWSGCS